MPTVSGASSGQAVRPISSLKVTKNRCREVARGLVLKLQSLQGLGYPENGLGFKV